MIVRILATWRLTQLLHHEMGPWEVFAKVRDLAGIRYNEYSEPISDSQIGKMLLCFWCTSIWAALIVAVLDRRFNLVEILAHSAGAILIEQVNKND